MRRLAFCIVLLAPLAAGAQTYTYLDQSLMAGGGAHTTLLITPDVVVSEISFGGLIEKRPEWSRRAADNVTNALRRAGARSKLRFGDLPALSGEERHALDQHVALFNVVALQVHRNSLGGGELWAKRLKSGLTDYTVGPGLAFLADKTGADSALLVIARDGESSAGNKAMIALGMLVGGGVRVGRTLAIAGLIDLRSGRLLWQGYDVNTSTDLREPEQTNALIDGLFKGYPGSGGR